jgi:hypothetical protein
MTLAKHLHCTNPNTSHPPIHDNINMYDIPYKYHMATVYPSLQDTIPHAVNQSYAPEDGQKIAQNVLSWSLEIINYFCRI